VLLTHGHIDHMWSVAPVCGAKDIPAYIHPDDRDLLTDPAKGISLLAQQQFLGGMTFSEPDDVRELADGAVIALAGLQFTVGHTPGHTPGSVTYGTPGQSADDAAALFSGDLLFAGSIGRTDLAGGDDAQMLRSLARTLTLPDATIVLPGHGPQTTIGTERVSNPFLTGLSRPAQKGL
jgi:hydroxyacylglutathione hydrolase